MKIQGRYFNFPVSLLKGFMSDTHQSLDQIFDYCIYHQAIKYEQGDARSKSRAAKNYFGLENFDSYECYKSGKLISSAIDPKSPKVGLSVKIWFEFTNPEKTDFEKVCLLGFLSFKSVIQKKSYCKVTNAYWLSRMAGSAKSDEVSVRGDVLLYELTKNEYRINKIKNELQLNWGLKYYSHFTRGFFVSFSMSLEDLIFQAEKKRKTRKESKLKEEKKQARLSALEILNQY